jgi:hypothetical protein
VAPNAIVVPYSTAPVAVAEVRHAMTIDVSVSCANCGPRSITAGPPPPFEPPPPELPDPHETDRTAASAASTSTPRSR